MYLIFNVALQKPLIQESPEFLGGSFLRYVNTLTSLVTIDIVMVGIQWF